jgi:hypothetical protein
MPVLPAVASMMVRSPVLHAATRVQVFELGKHIGSSLTDNAPELEHRCITNELGDVVSDPQAGSRGGVAHIPEYGTIRGNVNS